MVTLAPRCPECASALWVSPRVGLLCAHQSSCLLGLAEDAQLADDRSASGERSTGSRDYQREDHRWFGPVFTRPMTDVERTLVLACGADPAFVARSETAVNFTATAMRRRVFSAVRLTGLPGLPTADPTLDP